MALIVLVTNFTKPLPCIKPGTVTVGPFDANRVIAHKVHLIDRNFLGHSRRIENGLARPLVDALGAPTLPTHEGERQVELVVGPGNPQEVFLAQGLEVGGSIAHGVRKKGRSRRIKGL